MTQRITVILSRNRTAPEADANFQSQLAIRLGRLQNVKLFEIPHLYDLAPDGAALELLRSIEGPIVLAAWLYPRSSYWILRANQIEGRFLENFDQSEEDAPGRNIWCFDLRTHDRPQPFVEAIEQILSRPAGDSSLREPDAPAETVEETTRRRWYPIIDFDRCTHCLECLNFCLFGVFGVGTSNEIIIEEPNACRAGCPACSRICPQGAIIFPQHGDPAISGDANASLESLKLDLSQLFTGINPAETAQSERDRALAEKQRQETPPRKDELDDLVDELDDMDL